MREIAKIMPDGEFGEYLVQMREHLEKSQSTKGYGRKVISLVGMITATAGQRDEKVFTESQLKQIFELAGK